MFQFRKTGGDAVDAGTYWNFETGDKFSTAEGGILPGKATDSYYKCPPLLMLALTAAAAHVFLYLLPSYLVQFYAPLTAKLVTAYVLIDYLAIGILATAIAVAACADLFGFRRTLPAFNWTPSEAHLAGKRSERHNKSDQAAEDKEASKKTE